MRILRIATVAALVGVGVVIGYLAADDGASAASGNLSAQDYADIQQLYWRYNHGADFGRVLCGLQVPPDEKQKFRAFLKNLGYAYVEETNNPAYQLFLS